MNKIAEASEVLRSGLCSEIFYQKMTNEVESNEIPKQFTIDFGELRNDIDFITKSTNLEKVSNFCSIDLEFSGIRIQEISFEYWIESVNDFNFNFFLFHSVIECDR